MKHLFMITAACTVLCSAVSAQPAKTETRDGMRHVIVRDDTELNADGLLMQGRANELGLFIWSLPSEDPTFDPASRPGQVSDCEGHHPDYRPAHSYSLRDDQRIRKMGVGKAFLYDFAAYRNALAAGDCTCGTLRADWDTAVSQFTEITVGIERVSRFTAMPTYLHTLIQNDYERMCDVTMTLDLE